MLVGPGAGGEATASAVVADILDIARGIGRAPFGVPVAGARARRQRARCSATRAATTSASPSHDRPGAAAAIATRMAEREISLESIVQRRIGDARLDDPRGRSGEPVPVVLITYATMEATVREALAPIAADGFIAEPPQLIRIERE